jgi:hypothetical protein
MFALSPGAPQSEHFDRSDYEHVRDVFEVCHGETITLVGSSRTLARYNCPMRNEVLDLMNEQLESVKVEIESCEIEMLDCMDDVDAAEALKAVQFRFEAVAGELEASIQKLK